MQIPLNLRSRFLDTFLSYFTKDKIKIKNVRTYLIFVSNTHTTLHNSANMEPGPVGG